ncbi:acetate/propionate family kinase [Palleronia sediminis]|uniref:acetate/propionate family kinase n=1 Tax=Palleronia sediminis TaxID=2547833 RepID=UPI001F0F70DF|nr:acetate kinase [Palleronia sediminis]
MEQAILILNCGSSSVKAAVFDDALREVSRMEVTEIGGGARMDGRPVAAPDHRAAIEALLGRLPARPVCAAHRVVHGGAGLVAPCVIDAQTRAAIADAAALAPLHNPAALAGIDAVAAAAPGLPQVACFDTAFHATNPPEAVDYALPARWRAAGLRRYGFHGISYAGLVETLDPLPARLLACHLGNGASLCAIAGGRSVATTMGYSPLSGLVMGSRTGDIDGNAVLALAAAEGIAGASRILNRESGLRALGGGSDMRALHASPEGRAAIDRFVYWAVRHAGSMIAAMGGLDAIAFTGGIGENDAAVRGRIVAGLAFAGAVPVHVVPAREEAWIARAARACLCPKGAAEAGAAFAPARDGP